MANNQLLTYALIGIGIYFVVSSGALGGLFSSKTETVTDLYPSDLKTTITLNTQDKLATSPTDVTTDYFVFTSGGAFLSNGQTSSGTDSFTVPTGGNYKIIAFLDSVTEFLPVEATFSTDGADPTKRSVQTVNLELYKSSNATISTVRDPVDLDGNVTCTAANSACHFDVLFYATTSLATIGKPVIEIDVNSTAFDDITMSGLSEVPCPSRLTTESARTNWCFATGKDIPSSEGIVMYSGTLFVGAVGAIAGDEVNVTVIDTTGYLDADYQNAGYSAFHYGTENPVGKTNIGAADSNLFTLELA